MAVQVSYPGVYIEEFTPGAPIQGVGTSTAAFIGTASRGPIETPTPIQSWDAFEGIFGGFIPQQPTSYLAPAVFGFFLNGGTNCFVVRVGTGVMSEAELDSRQGGGSPDPALIARARVEGPAGDSISVQVVDSSRLSKMLADAGEADIDLAVHHAETNITAFDTGTRMTVTVGDNAGFARGDRILLTKGADSAQGIVDSTQGTDTIVLLAPAGGTTDFATGDLRSDDLAPGQRTFRLTVPSAVRLNQAVPRGSTVSVTLGGTSEIRTVESSGGDTLTLTEGLGSLFSLDDPLNLPRVASLEFDLAITDAASGGDETFAQLAMNAQHPMYWGTAVQSEFITLEETAAPPAPMPDDPRPAAAIYNLAGGQADDRQQALADLIADPNQVLDLLKPHDEVSIVAAPGVTDLNVQDALNIHCETMYDRFAILDSIQGVDSGQGIQNQLAAVRSPLGFSALYYPWILARNPLTGKDELWPPSGHIAGVYARTDQQRGVFKAPANANIRGALGLETLLTNEQQGPLNLLGVNVLRVFQGQARPVIWGARTTATTIDANWQYVNIRRLFLFLEESIEVGIRWAVFEPNNLQLWQKLKRTITDFLTRVWRDGALFGATPEKAFYVRIDEVLNPFSEQQLGRLNIEIGVRPTFAAEFVIVRIGIWAGGSEISES